ncbi:hypothetical protein VKT23_015899 [Stygiomarasmius scandens]|uniref:Uncharacterized protein n=1 Tax=Marasmiellus scandens TaxID=2682957 RepID=A0ABR1IWA5_9AGAR
MSSNNDKTRKPRKNWLTAADANPSIPPPPPALSGYRYHPYKVPITSESRKNLTNITNRKTSLPYHLLRKPKRTEDEKLVEKLKLVDSTLRRISKDFGCTGEFPPLLFWDRIYKKDEDLRTKFYREAVAHFISGRSSVKAAQVVDSIYSHRASNPSGRSLRKILHILFMRIPHQLVLLDRLSKATPLKSVYERLSRTSLYSRRMMKVIQSMHRQY